MKTIITYAEYITALGIIKEYKSQCVEHINEINNTIGGNFKLLNTPINLTEKLSKRAVNVLKANSEHLNISDVSRGATVAELSKVSRLKLLKCNGIGHKSLTEIEDLCIDAGIKLLD